MSMHMYIWEERKGSVVGDIIVMLYTWVNCRINFFYCLNSIDYGARMKKSMCLCQLNRVRFIPPALLANCLVKPIFHSNQQAT